MVWRSQLREAEADRILLPPAKEVNVTVSRSTSPWFEGLIEVGVHEVGDAQP